MKSDKTIIIAVIAVIVVVFGVIVFLIVNRGDSQTAEENGQPAAENGQTAENGETGEVEIQELPTLAETADAAFDDVSKDDYYAPAVGWMLENKLTGGCDEDSFCPQQQIPREQFIVFLWRAAGTPEPAMLGSEIFTDVSGGSFADEAIGWATEEEVTTGCRNEEDGTRFFCPKRIASRAHIATFLYRHVGAAHEPSDSGSFEDVETGVYYAAPVAWMAAYEISGGCSEDNFCPNDLATRAQAATLIRNVAETPASWGTNGILRIPYSPN